MTQRLYYTDSYLREFEASVIGVRTHAGRLAAVLDRTAFYPTSGGQPHDIGTLDGTQVVDVVEDGETILHIVTGQIAQRVRGRIDWPRRFDHMQQHTGQHILSQASLVVLNAQTRSVHFGTDASTVDLEVADLTASAGEQVEDQANHVVFEDRPVTAREVDEADLAGLGLRRPAKKGGRIRIVEVEGFDRSACGGTHVRRTGEVGPIKIRRWERFRGGIRAEFLCGWRTLRDYQWKNALIVNLAGRLTVKDRELDVAIERLEGQVRDRGRLLAELRDRLLDAEARARLAAAAGSPKVIAEVLGRWSADEVAGLAAKIAAAETAVAMFGTADGKLVLARSPEVPLDASVLLRHVVEPRGGRGGGRAEFAQGAVPEALVSETVEAARMEIIRSIAAHSANNA